MNFSKHSPQILARRRKKPRPQKVRSPLLRAPGLPKALPFAVRLTGGVRKRCRLFHHPALYKRVHKLHHEWTAPVGVVSIYAHPLEHVVANLLPALSGPVLLGSHLCTLWLWMTVVIVSTTIDHSGYHFPLLRSPEFHDFHHLK